MTLQQHLQKLTTAQKRIVAKRLRVHPQYVDHLIAGRKRVGYKKAVEYAAIFNMTVEQVSPHLDWVPFRRYFTFENATQENTHAE